MQRDQENWWSIVEGDKTRTRNTTEFRSTPWGPCRLQNSERGPKRICFHNVNRNGCHLFVCWQLILILHRCVHIKNSLFVVLFDIIFPMAILYNLDFLSSDTDPHDFTYCTHRMMWHYFVSGQIDFLSAFKAEQLKPCILFFIFI